MLETNVPPPSSGGLNKFRLSIYPNQFGHNEGGGSMFLLSTSANCKNTENSHFNYSDNMQHTKRDEKYTKKKKLVRKCRWNRPLDRPMHRHKDNINVHL